MQAQPYHTSRTCLRLLTGDGGFAFFSFFMFIRFTFAAGATQLPTQSPRTEQKQHMAHYINSINPVGAQQRSKDSTRNITKWSIGTHPIANGTSKNSTRHTVVTIQKRGQNSTRNIVMRSIDSVNRFETQQRTAVAKTAPFGSYSSATTEQKQHQKHTWYKIWLASSIDSVQRFRTKQRTLGKTARVIYQHEVLRPISVTKQKQRKAHTLRYQYIVTSQPRSKNCTRHIPYTAL